MSSFLYFAYGSNMLAERLRARCRSAKPLCVATVVGYVLTFTKKSMDGSGKAEMRSTNDNGVIHGVVFQIDETDARALHKAEGPGYERMDALRAARLTDGKIIEARTYLGKASSLETGLKPYDWYLALAVGGAVRGGLSEAYVAGLREVAFARDEDGARQADALALLKSASFESVETVLGIR